MQMLRDALHFPVTLRPSPPRSRYNEDMNEKIDSAGMDSFRSWILQQASSDYAIEQVSADEIRLKTEHAEARIQLYPEIQIVEFSIFSLARQENVFYLHFQLEDEKRAHELFAEMIDSLRALPKRERIRVLLCCTSGLTTSFFGEQLKEAAEVLHLDMEFSAVPLAQLYESGFDHDVILLAPQVGYVYEKVSAIFHQQIVLKIPTRIFASYDTGGMLRLIQEQIEERRRREVSPSASAQLLAEHSSGRYLLISIRIMDRVSIHYRLYNSGRIQLDETFLRYGHTMKLEDLEDIIKTVLSRGMTPDEIGISTPGNVSNGRIFLNLIFFEGPSINVEEYLKQKYGIPTVILNNMNAAALGLYYRQETYQDLVLIYQPPRHAFGGAGVILGGKLLVGRNGIAGETKYMAQSLSTDIRRQVLSPEGMLDLVARMIAGIQGIVGPQAVYLSSPMTPDMEEVRKALSEYLPKEEIPDLIRIDDLTEPIFYGLLLHLLNLKKEAK